MTSTITSSGVRQTPGFTVPSTQNTAPVLDYRCLYTHDLRRKQKRWQDGLLRFHTFNKRIMVYDVSRNYIGDMHWRENEILQDGDEFQLDRGVLIQVGEATGAMEQDLTELLERRKKAPELTINEDVSHQPPAIPIAGPTQPSQLRAKSLNALLGTPKGRIGRAALPTKSPHELRTEDENSSWDHYRPAKRQRIEPHLERRVEPNRGPPPRVPATFRAPDEGVNRTIVRSFYDGRCEDGCVPTNVRDTSRSRGGEAVSRQPILSYPVDKNDKENGKEDKASKRLVDALPKEKYGKSRSSELTARPQKRKPDQDASVSPKGKITAKPREHGLETGHARMSTSTKPIEIASDEDATSTNHQPTRRSKLLMASRKPRKKLMYRDLLPQESPATDRNPDEPSIPDQSSRNRTTLSRLHKGSRDPIAPSHKEEQERLKARLIKRDRAKDVQRDNERKEYSVDTPEDLFLSQEDIGIKSANHHGTQDNELWEKTASSSMIGSRRRNTEPVTSSSHRSLPRKAAPEVIPIPPSTVHSTAMNLAKMDEVLFASGQPRSSGSVEDKVALAEVLPQDSSSPSVSKTLPVALSTISLLKERPGSSPAFQTQAHVPLKNSLYPEDSNETSTVSRLHLDPQCTFTKVVQPKKQEHKKRTPMIPSPDSYLSLAATFRRAVPPHSAPKEDPMSAQGLEARLDREPARSPSPEPQTRAIGPPKIIVKPNLPPASSKVVAPKPPSAPVPAPKHKASERPACLEVNPILPIPTSNDETVEVPSSQPPSPPLPEAPAAAPHPPKRKPDSLPAFTKVVPTKPRFPLKKSVSDTSAMRPPAVLPAPGGMEKALPESSGGRDESVGVWGKEAWDLFGCGRDGVECGYEEFKRKEGVV